MASNARPPESAAIAVFAKAPRAGEVKTRLVPGIGAVEAARLHTRLVQRTLEATSAAAPGRVELWCAPDTDDPFFVQCAARWKVTLHTQQGADLGARMADAFARSHAQGRPLVIVGTDCPQLTVDDLREAMALLAMHDGVIAPAEDGGYVLIGLAHPAPSLFEGIAWSGPGVMQATRDRARAARLDLAEMGTFWDVDRPEDVVRLEREGLL
jgi:rSAM/selenodomain-associated transferase 1